jgi:hypothetical protein
MARFMAGIAMLLGASVSVYLVRPFMQVLITGTSLSENIMTYFIPIALFVAMIIGVFVAWFKRQPKPPV